MFDKFIDKEKATKLLLENIHCYYELCENIVFI